MLQQIQLVEVKMLRRELVTGDDEYSRSPELDVPAGGRDVATGRAEDAVVGSLEDRLDSGPRAVRENGRGRQLSIREGFLEDPEEAEHLIAALEHCESPRQVRRLGLLVQPASARLAFRA